MTNPAARDSSSVAVRGLRAACAVLVAIAFAPQVAFASAAAPDPAWDARVVAVAPERVLVRFKPQMPGWRAESQAALAGARVNARGRGLAKLGWTVLEPAAGESAASVLVRIAASGTAAQVEFDVVARRAQTPDDSMYSQLWGMNNTGQVISGQTGTAGADISAQEAWDTNTGSSETIVAIVDTGIDFSHPDLAPNAWVNPLEVAGNGIDDDGNGLVDDVNGWDFANNDSTVFDPLEMDPFGHPYNDSHATHVAGTIGAVGDNAYGVTGVNWDVRIMSLKFIAEDTAFVSDGAEAIVYAVDHGATVINHSWTSSPSPVLDYAMAYAAEHDVLNVAAAGNNYGLDIDASPTYPASMIATNVVAVAATTNTDGLAAFSNVGVASVDLGAPGENILSTLPDSDYGIYNGTSMATPHVTGAVALLHSAHPEETATDLRRRIESTVDPLASLDGKVATGGRLNLAAAIADYGPEPIITSPLTGDHLTRGSTASITFDPRPGTDPAATFEAQIGVGTEALADGGFEVGSLVGWSTSGNTPAFYASSTPAYVHSGSYGARSGAITHSQYCEISRSVTLPQAGVVSFWYWLSAEDGWDYGYLEIDGVKVWQTMVDSPWTFQTWPVSAGTHTIGFGYYKDSAVSEDLDAFGIDDVRVTSYSWNDSEPIPVGVHSAAIAVPDAETVNAAVRVRTLLGARTSAWETEYGIVLDSFSLDGGAAYATTTTVSADSSVPDAVDMAFDVPGLAPGAWEPYAAHTSLTLAGEGLHTVTAHYRNAALEVVTRTDSIFVDSTAPEIAVAGLPAEGHWATDPVWATLSASDAGSGLESVRYRLNGVEAVYSAPVSIPEGLSTFEYWARDRAGNESDPVSVSVWVDTIAPGPVTSLSAVRSGDDISLTWVNPADGDFDHVRVVSRLGTPPSGPDDPLASLVYEGSAQAATDTGAYDGSQQGELYYAAYAYDAAGNLATGAATSIAVDIVDPSGTFQLDGGADYTTTVTVTADSTMTGATEMAFDVPGFAPGAWEPFAVQRMLVLSGEGLHTVTARYRNAALEETSRTDAIRVDWTAPSVDVSGLPAQDAWATSAVSATLEGFDAGSGVGSVHYRIGAGSESTYTVPVPIPEGTSTFDYWARDLAGNESAHVTRTVRVDSLAPAAPTGVAVDATGMGWTHVRWNAVAAADTAFYSLYRSQPAAGLRTLVGTVDAGEPLEWLDSGLTDDLQYGYVVTATDVHGNDSALSAQAVAAPGVDLAPAAGATRYATAMIAALDGFDTAPTVVLATGADYADALGASALAGAHGAPVLLTPRDSLPGGLLGALDTLGTERVIVVGGTAAVSSAVETQLDAVFGATHVDRIAGTDRYDTAARVAAATIAVRGSDVATAAVFVVRGSEFADALAVAPVAYGVRAPILLVKPTSVPPVTLAAIQAGGYSRAVVVGGEAAVTSGVANGLGIDWERISGATRYRTAEAFAYWAQDSELATFGTVGLATGADFPDALGGGAVVGHEGGVLLLTTRDELSPAADDAIASHATAVSRLRVFGGDAAISAQARASAQALVGR